MNGDLSLTSMLPVTWRMARLKHVASARYGKALPTDSREKAGQVPVFGSSTTTGFHDVAFHQKPSIVIGRKGTVGSVQYVNVPFWPIDTVFFLDNVSPCVDLRFLAAALTYFGLERYKIVVGVPGINRGDLENFQFPLPPLSEQQRIVDILQEAEEIRRFRAEAEAKTAELIPRFFISVFGDPGQNPKKWPRETLASLAEKYSDGPFGSNLKSSHYVDRGVRVVRLQNIGVGSFLGDDEAFISEEHFASLAKHECLPGDVLIGTLGDPNLRACILPIKVGRALNKADCVQFRPDRSKVTAAYACWLLNMPGTLRMAQSLQAGQTRSRISMGRLAPLKVPCPPLELQLEFEKAVQEISEAEESIRQSVKTEEALASSLSAHAFSGQLTADWREAHQERLAIEARDRDAALKEAGATSSFLRRETIQEMEAFFQDRTDGIYSDLNREQRVLLRELNRMVGGVHYARYFSAKMLSDYISEGPLRRNPQAIEEHLAVLAARGLIILVSREEQTEDTGEFVFGNAYRLPLGDHEPREGEEGEPLIGDHARLHELERLAAQVEKERARS